MELYLIRHAIAENRDPERWLADAERPLSEKGRRGFRRAASGLRSLGAEPPAVVLASPAARAWETGQILAEGAGWPEPVQLEALDQIEEPDRIAALLSGYVD